MRARRPKYSDQTPDQKIKSLVRSTTKVLIVRGKIKKQPCELCGSKKSEAHHTDYDNPRQVRWLCRKHHLAEHNTDPLLPCDTASLQFEDLRYNPKRYELAMTLKNIMITENVQLPRSMIMDVLKNQFQIRGI